MRTACPLSSGIGVTSAMSEPPLLRIGSTSIGLLVSNSSHTVSARRNNAAGVTAANANVKCRPSLSRRALTLALLPMDLDSAALDSGALDSGAFDSATLDSRGASEATGDILGAALAAGAGISFAAGSGIGASATGAGISLGASLDGSLDA